MADGPAARDSARGQRHRNRSPQPPRSFRRTPPTLARSHSLTRNCESMGAWRKHTARAPTVARETLSSTTVDTRTHAHTPGHPAAPHHGAWELACVQGCCPAGGTLTSLARTTHMPPTRGAPARSRCHHKQSMTGRWSRRDARRPRVPPRLAPGLVVEEESRSRVSAASVATTPATDSRSAALRVVAEVVANAEGRRRRRWCWQR